MTAHLKGDKPCTLDSISHKQQVLHRPERGDVYPYVYTHKPFVRIEGPNKNLLKVSAVELKKCCADCTANSPYIPFDPWMKQDSLAIHRQR